MKTIYEFLLKSKTATSTQDADYVDLGLPSGLLWAKCNIGADAPHDCGDYFMWGSTEPDTDWECNWRMSPFNDNKQDLDIEYIKSIKDDICQDYILKSEYDAATVILGNEWRMPTKDDFSELINNTNGEWVENYQDSNIRGRLFTSTKNKAQIFIPAAGYKNGNRISRIYTFTDLWSSKMNNAYNEYADTLFISKGAYYIRSTEICYGLNIRAVKETK